MTRLSTTFGADFLRFQDILASYLAPAPFGPATTPFDPATAPLGLASTPSNNDEMLGEEDFDLADF